MSEMTNIMSRNVKVVCYSSSLLKPADQFHTQFHLHSPLTS